MKEPRLSTGSVPESAFAVAAKRLAMIVHRMGQLASGIAAAAVDWCVACLVGCFCRNFSTAVRTASSAASACCHQHLLPILTYAWTTAGTVAYCLYAGFYPGTLTEETVQSSVARYSLAMLESTAWETVP